MTAAATAPVLMGNQTATTELLQPGTPNILAEKLAEAIGITLMPWQRHVLGQMTARHGGHWAAREVLLLVPRQQGKSLCLALRILAGALLLGEKDILFSAHEYATSKSFFRELSDLIKGNTILDRELVRSYTSNGDFRMIFRNGSQLRLLARTAHAGRGLHPDLIVFDESFSVSEDVLTALIPAQAARPDPQVIWASSAGDDTSDQLLRMRARLHSGNDPYLSGWDWHAPTELPVDDPETWARALPSYGTLTSELTVRQAFMTMTQTAFRREFLGQWAEAIESRVFTAEQIEAVLGPAVPAPDDPQGSSLAFGVEVQQTGTTRTAASVVACWLDVDLNPVFSVVRSEPGVDWLGHFVRYLSSAYRGAPIAFDAKSPGLDVYERITRDGEIEMIKVTWPDYSRTCSAFLQAVVERRATVCRTPTSLASDMAAAKQKTSGAAWCWDRMTPTPPASLIAATCAMFATELSDHGLPEIL